MSVSDGFNRTRIVSAPVRVDGSPPVPTIVLPADGDELPAGRLLLLGSALDDRGRPLRGRALMWYAGSRRLGTGERLRPRPVRLVLPRRPRTGVIRLRLTITARGGVRQPALRETVVVLRAGRRSRRSSTRS